MNTIKNKLPWMAALLLPLMLLSCGKGDKEHLAVDERPTVMVKTQEAGVNTSDDHFTISGKIEAVKSVQVSSRLMGSLTSVTAKVGDRVYAGQTLATISNTDIQARMAQAEAGILEAQTGLANMEKDYARIKSLFEKQSATQKELDDITAGRDMMQARLDQANQVKNEVSAMLSYSVVTAPFSGIITEKHVNSGDLASPGRPLFSLESGNDFQASALVPESYVNSVAIGDKVTVVLKSTGDEIGGAITEFSMSSMNTGGQYRVKIGLDKSDLKDINLLSGMYLNVLVPKASDDLTTGSGSGITVPESAIVREGQLTGIYKVSQQGTAVLQWVRLGGQVGDEVEILSGLSAGEEFIVESDGRLLNGVNVSK